MLFAQSVVVVTPKTDTLRRKTKKIRDKSRRLTAAFSDSFHLSLPKFTKSGFYSTKDAQIRPKSVMELPTKFIINVLNQIPAKDLIKLRLVSKDFDQIIQNHAMELPKIEKEVLNLRHPGNDEDKICPIGRSCSPADFENMDKALRHVKSHKLGLTKITITSKLIRYLQRSIKYELSELRFNECSFLIKSSELAIMIKPWEPKFLHFNNCKWIPNSSNPSEDFQQTFLDDLFFSVNKSFDFLCVDFSSTFQHRLGFSDKISKVFQDRPNLPSTLIFDNCLKNITVKTLKTAIQRYVDFSIHFDSSALPQQFQWSFGAIDDSYFAVTSMLTTFQEYIVSQRKIPNGIECTFQVKIDSPLLYFSVKCLPFNLSKNLPSKKCNQKVFWEESGGFDFPEGFLT